MVLMGSEAACILLHILNFLLLVARCHQLSRSGQTAFKQSFLLSKWGVQMICGVLQFNWPQHVLLSKHTAVQ